jgi:hypothetical protein
MTKPKPPKKPPKAKRIKVKPPTPEEAVNLLVAAQRARARIEDEVRRLQSDFMAERDQRVADLVRDLTAKGELVGERLDVLAKVTAGEERLKTFLGEGDKIILDTVIVEDPFMSHAEIVEQRKRYTDATEIGRIKTKANMVTLVGGFARFEHKTSAEIAAAMRFLSLHQQAEISTAKGTDYAQPKVNTSWSGDSEKAMLSGYDAVQELEKLKTAIGDQAFRLLDLVVVRDVPIRTIAGPEASGGRVSTWGRRVRQSLSLCAEHWRLTGAAKATAEVTGWRDGSQTIYTGEVVNPVSRHPLDDGTETGQKQNAA